MMPYVDVFQVGARNMQNFNLLRELGTSASLCCSSAASPPPSKSCCSRAEYILSGGNYDLMLCERGIRTFETYTRNTMDISAIPVVKKLSHLPMLGDPSHGTGRRDKVPAMARAAVAAGARRPAHRGASQSRQGGLRRRPVARSRTIRKADGVLRVIAPAVEPG